MADPRPASIVPFGITRGVLFAFLLAVLIALGITLWSTSDAVRLLALVAVTPVVALTLLFLSYEHKLRSWSFLGAAVLGAFGVTLRILVSTRPALEVGGGLPVTVTIVYVALGLAVIGTSLWSYASLHSIAGPMSG